MTGSRLQYVQQILTEAFKGLRKEEVRMAYAETATVAHCIVGEGQLARGASVCTVDGPPFAH